MLDKKCYSFVITRMEICLSVHSGGVKPALGPLSSMFSGCPWYPRVSHKQFSVKKLKDIYEENKNLKLPMFLV